MRIGVNSLFYTKSFEDNIDQIAKQFDLNVDLVHMQDDEYVNMDALAYPIHMVDQLDTPFNKKAALIPLGSRSYSLLIANDLLNPNHRFGFPDMMKVIGPKRFLGSRLKNIHHSVDYQSDNINSIIERVLNGNQINVVIETGFLPEGADKHYKVIDLNPKEFGHAPGQGYMVLLTQADSLYHKLIRKMNRHEYIAISNIERKTAELSDELVNIHCEISEQGNYQLWLFTKDKEVQISQNTRIKIEESILEKLQTA